MNRDWVLAQLYRIEHSNEPSFSWAKTDTCARFTQGKCQLGSLCKYVHTQSAIKVTVPTHTQPDIAGDPGSNTTPSSDATMVEVSCRSKAAPDCTPIFRTQLAYWKTLKTSDGKEYQLPKSCTACRRFNKAQKDASMITEIVEESDAGSSDKFTEASGSYLEALNLYQ